MSLAWHIAALQRVRKMPKLDRLLVKVRQQRRQTPEQMLAIVRMMAGSPPDRKV
jgi:hypothetical protein